MFPPADSRDGSRANSTGMYAEGEGGREGASECTSVLVSVVHCAGLTTNRDRLTLTVPELVFHPMSFRSWCRQVKSPNPTMKYTEQKQCKTWGPTRTVLRTAKTEQDQKLKWDHTVKSSRTYSPVQDPPPARPLPLASVLSLVATLLDWERS